MRKHFGFIIFFVVIIFIFLGKLIFLKASFLYGDYQTQFYPWSLLYAESIKNFKLPFWTPYIQCGFPLFAEGQIGVFYPFNLLLFFFLPDYIAYTYSPVLSFILAGIFTYIFARSLGLENITAFVPVMLFLFGSSYAGCFYNTVSQRALIWFPLGLLFINLYLRNKKILYIFLLGITFGIQLLAGFQQLAIYSIGMSTLYFILALFLFDIRLTKLQIIKHIILLGIALVIGLLVSLPQLYSTYQLAKLSNRQEATVGFALWGSFSPFGIITTIFPYWGGFLGAKLYIGILPLAFVIVSLFNLQDKYIKIFALLTLVSIFLAFGKYNPLYTILLKITNFYQFRNPSKFLFFISFFMTILSSLGLKAILKEKDPRLLSKTIKTFAFVGITAILLCIMINATLRIFEKDIMSLANYYVSKFIYGNPFHRHSLDYYLNAVKGLFEVIVKYTSIFDRYAIVAIMLMIFSLALLNLLKKKMLSLRSFGYLSVILIFLDIYIFSFHGTGFRGNIGPLNEIKKVPAVVKFLKEDKEIFRIYQFGIGTQEKSGLRPNSNIMFKIQNIGAYTPLAMRRPYKLLSDLGVVDDALGLVEPHPGVLGENMNLLNFLNVKYILSEQALKLGNLEFVEELDGIKIYKNKTFLPRTFFVSDFKVIKNEDEILSLIKSKDFLPEDFVILENKPNQVKGSFKKLENKTIEIKTYKPELIEIYTQSDQDALLILSDTYYPGWKAHIDNNQTEIFQANYNFRAIFVPKGIHKIMFSYNPFNYETHKRD